MEGPLRPSRPVLIALILLALLAIAAGPRLIGGYFDLARAEALRASHPLEAAGYYESAAGRLPWRVDLLEQAGLAALAGGDSKQAIGLLAPAGQRKQLSPQGTLALGDAYLQTGDKDAAWDLWSGMAARHQDSAELYQRLAPMQEQRGMIKQAAESWRGLIGLAPDNALAHYRLGLILASQTPAEGLPDLITAARLDPALDANVRVLRTELNTAMLQDDAAYQLLVAGRALGAVGEWSLAQQAFENAVRRNKDYAEAWAWLAEACEHNGLFDLAGQYLGYALALDPGSAGVQALSGLYWQRQHEAGKAQAAFREAIRLDPQNASWYAALGDAQTSIGDLPGALVSYEKTVELAPQEPAYWRLLALFCADHNTQIIDTGLPAAFTALQLEPKDPVNLDVLGRLLLEAGYGASAETILLRAVAAAPDSAAARFHLGLLYLNQGKTRQAYAELVKARDLDAAGPVGMQAARVLERYFLP